MNFDYTCYGKRTVFTTALQVRLSSRQTVTGRGFVVIHVQSRIRFLFQKPPRDSRATCLLRVVRTRLSLKSVKCIRPCFVCVPLTDRSSRISHCFFDKRTLLSYCGNNHVIFFEARCRRIRNISQDAVVNTALHVCTNISYLFLVSTRCNLGVFYCNDDPRKDRRREDFARVRLVPEKLQWCKLPNQFR